MFHGFTKNRIYVAKDPKHAARLRNIKAFHYSGKSYRNGDGTPVNHEKALEYFLKSAKGMYHQS